MAGHPAPRARYGEAFWRAHHEAWKRSDLNQREYCEAHGLTLKRFGNWQAKFSDEAKASQKGLLHRRGNLSHMSSYMTDRHNQPTSTGYIPSGKDWPEARRDFRPTLPSEAGFGSQCTSNGGLPLMRWTQEMLQAPHLSWLSGNRRILVSLTTKS